MYKLNLIPDKVLPVIRCSQFDKNREIKIALFNGEDEYTPSSCYVVIGNTTIQGTINNNVFTFLLDESLTQEETTLLGEVVIGDRLGTCNFMLEVEYTPKGEEE